MIYFKDEERQGFSWLDKDSRLFLERGYLKPGVTAEDRILEIAVAAGKILDLDGFAEIFYDYMSKGYYSLSSPIWANFGLDRGLPISCFGSYVGDSIEDIMSTVAEVGVMSKVGGGTSAYFGEVRPRGSDITDNGKSNGSFSFCKLFDTTIDVISQGTSRKGQFAGYIDIEHGDIHEWLDIHTEGNPIQLMYYGVSIGKEWFQQMKDGDQDKREIWAKILTRRSETGIPYLFFRDNANDGRPDVYKDNNMKVHASNLCTEIMLPSTTEESFVCCLSSMNLLHYDEWADTNAVEVLTLFLDAVLTEFISKARKIQYLEKAVRFAENHRAIGIGVLGWHDYLQTRMIPFDSYEAMQINAAIFRNLKSQTYKTSEYMYYAYGAPKLLQKYKRRNATLLSIAPTKSSSFILGSVSPSVEPLTSNYYIKDLAKIKTTYKNKILRKVLQSMDQDTPEVWESILLNDGSVQHLDFLPQLVKDTFKTFREISQLSIIQQAAQRQQFIDQGQSINLMIHPDTPVKDLNKLYITAEELGLKSLYYQHSINAAQEFNRDLLTCSSCEG